jgi:hypothetical protein
MSATRSTRCRIIAAAMCAVAASLTGGCIVQNNEDPGPTTITVVLVNETNFVLDANFFASPTATNTDGLFVQANIYTGYSDKPIPTVAARQTVSFELACGDARSIGVSHPVFSNPVTLTGGESADELFLVRDTNYVCGDRIVFRYSHPGNFRVNVRKE